jgi:hypothetical protein
VRLASVVDDANEVSRASALIALPALRLSSWYFVLITIAFAEVVAKMAGDLRELTGGYGGIVGIRPPSLFGMSFGLAAMFWFVLLLNLAALWLVRNIVDSRIGWALRSVRDGDVRAHASGVSSARTTLFAFLAAGALAGLACCDQLADQFRPERAQYGIPLGPRRDRGETAPLCTRPHDAQVDAFVIRKTDLDHAVVPMQLRSARWEPLDLELLRVSQLGCGLGEEQPLQLLALGLR